MQALAFWKAVTVDDSNLLERFFELLRVHNVRFCLIDGQAVNAYAEPVVSLDLDVVIASERLRIRRDEEANGRRISPISPVSSKRNRSFGPLSRQTCLPGSFRAYRRFPPFPPFPPYLPLLPLMSTSIESGRPLTKSIRVKPSGV